MNSARIAVLLLAAAGSVAAAPRAGAANVDVSMNVFPTTLSMPNNGGTWQVVAKTDAPLGIQAINMYVLDVNIAGIFVEPDINALTQMNGMPFVGQFGLVINMVYGQNITEPGIVVGVGTSLLSDGPDPLGDPVWDDATKIISGTYSGMVPAFTSLGSNVSDANVLASPLPNVAALDADTTVVVRVLVPEPASAGLAIFAALGLSALRRRR